MKRIIAMLGALLIATMVIISGSAVAGWVASVYYSTACTSIGQITGAPNGLYASLGQNGPPPVLGWAILDLGPGNEMPSSQNFVVYAQTPAEENYTVWVGQTSDVEYMQYVGQGTDDRNQTFTTPSSPPTASWRYILIVGATGVPALAGGDHAYGPDIDAVGW